jgi:hypothetical protein
MARSGSKWNGSVTLLRGTCTVPNGANKIQKKCETGEKYVNLLGGEVRWYEHSPWQCPECTQLKKNTFFVNPTEFFICKDFLNYF